MPHASERPPPVPADKRALQRCSPLVTSSARAYARMVAVFGLFVRAVLGFYRRAARAHGLGPAETGAITFVQRFGSSANLHIHAHVLVMDGVFTAAESGELTFHKLPAPSDRELQALLAVVRQRVRLSPRGMGGPHATRVRLRSSRVRTLRRQDGLSKLHPASRRNREDLGPRRAHALNRHGVFQPRVRLTRGAADG